MTAFWTAALSALLGAACGGVVAILVANYQARRTLAVELQVQHVGAAHAALSELFSSLHSELGTVRALTLVSSDEISNAGQADSFLNLLQSRIEELDVLSGAHHVAWVNAHLIGPSITADFYKILARYDNWLSAARKMLTVDMLEVTSDEDKIKLANDLAHLTREKMLALNATIMAFNQNANAARFYDTPRAVRPGGWPLPRP